MKKLENLRFLCPEQILNIGRANEQDKLLSDAELSDTLREMFRRMDADGSGTLSEEELRAALAELGVQAEPTQVRAMLQVADADGDARVKEDEFVDESVAIASGCARRDTWRREGRGA